MRFCNATDEDFVAHLTKGRAGQKDPVKAISEDKLDAATRQRLDKAIPSMYAMRATIQGMPNNAVDGKHAKAKPKDELIMGGDTDIGDTEGD